MASNIAIESKGTAIEGDLLDKLRTQLSVKANQGRDWRWLFRRINLPNRDISTFERSIDPIGDIFTECHAEQIYIARLRNILQNIGVGDAIESIDHDIEGLELENYTAQHATQQASQPIVAVELVGSTPCSYIYDVVVLYDDSIEVDREFAHKIIAILKMFGLQVFDAENDVEGGAFTTLAIMSRMGEQSEFVLAVVSNGFFANVRNTFFADYAQSLGVNTCSRKIVSIIKKIPNETSTIPSNLSFLHTIYYDQEKSRRRDYCFLSRLLKSLWPTRPVPFNEYKKCILKFIEENNSRTSFPLRQPLPHTTRQYFVNAAAKSSLTSKQQPQLAIPGVATDGVDDEGNTSGTFSLYTQAFFDMERLILNSTADRAVPEPESPKKRKRSRLVKYTQIGMRFLRPGHCGIVDRPDES